MSSNVVLDTSVRHVECCDEFEDVVRDTWVSRQNLTRHHAHCSYPKKRLGFLGLQSTGSCDSGDEKLVSLTNLGQNILLL